MNDMRYTAPVEFELDGSRIFVYDNFHSYVVCSKGGSTSVRIIKLPAPKNAFIIYGDDGYILAAKLGGVFSRHSPYYAAPIFLGTW